MMESEPDCNGCNAFTLMEIITTADSFAEDTVAQSRVHINKEDLVKVRKLHYIATVAENGLSKMRVDGKLCRQCPWYDK
jgi:hypothetical protein